jgi:hypothetical protein
MLPPLPGIYKQECVTVTCHAFLAFLRKAQSQRRDSLKLYRYSLFFVFLNQVRRDDYRLLI